MKKLQAAPASIEKLRWIMAQLRDPATGCPWDIKQTFQSVVPHTLEEAYEVADAIEQGDFEHLPAELGDLLFQVIFYSQLAQEQQLFTLDTVLEQICEKLIRRHPHVFADAKLTNDAEIKANWEREKANERLARSEQASVSLLADIPNYLPALSQAQKIQKRCAHVGFDWPDIQGVVEKVMEELEEVQQELTMTKELNSPALGAELGDLLFSVVNLCRHAGFDAESLMRQANQKFTKRFQQVEQKVEQSERSFAQHDVTQLEQYWQQVKQAE
jgi:nucleoside triphosphate diphosphatase